MSGLFQSSSGSTQVIEYMKQEEILELCFYLQRYHGIFNQFINVGTPVFDSAIPTAAVYAERDTGNFLYLRINPDFWAAQTLVQKLFIISHECLHIILMHLVRFSNYDNEDILSKAIDIVVNHMCVEKLGFKRTDIDPDAHYCWADTCFEDATNIPTNETVDYYYQLLKTHGKNTPQGGNVLDIHLPLDPEAVKAFQEKMQKNLSDEDKEKLNKMCAGVNDVMQWKVLKISVKQKKKWETVIKRWAIQTIGYKDKPKDQWIRKNRRNALLKGNLFLPSEAEHDEPLKEKKKIKVFFFLDTSASCHHLAERFFKAAKSLPTNRFDIRLFCFHTSVVETDITQNKVAMGGGTAFDIIEKKVQDITKKENIDYPRAIFIISDGDGNAVSPEFPERWHWFLSTKHKSLIPKKSFIYNLEDYE